MKLAENHDFLLKYPSIVPLLRKGKKLLLILKIRRQLSESTRLHFFFLLFSHVYERKYVLFNFTTPLRDKYEIDCHEDARLAYERVFARSAVDRQGVASTIQTLALRWRDLNRNTICKICGGNGALGYAFEPWIFHGTGIVRLQCANALFYQQPLPHTKRQNRLTRVSITSWRH